MTTRHTALVALLTAAALVTLLPEVAPAISITSVTPANPTTGQNVTVTAGAQTVSVAACPVTVTFGDGSPSVAAGSCPAPGACTVSASHVYTTAGTFTVSAEGPGAACFPPTLATRTVVVTAAAAGPVTATVSPSSVSIPRNQTTAINLTYTFSGSNTTLQSTTGTFQAGGSTLGTVSTPVSATITNGRGVVSESVLVPPAISLRAESLGATNITYTRTFTGTGALGLVTITTTAAVTVTSGTTSQLSINSMRLYFPNARPEITIQRNQLLRAFVDIGYTGTGRLSGFWEVDGALLVNVYQDLSFGGVITLESPAAPPLPTFVPRPHIVRFVITSPAVGVSFPEAIYFITPEETIQTRIRSVSPADNAIVDFGEMTFRWDKEAAAAAYLTEFFEKDPSVSALAPPKPPVFSAYAKDTTYSIPAAIRERTFIPGKSFLWRVTAFDRQGVKIAESPLYSFTVR